MEHRRRHLPAVCGGPKQYKNYIVHKTLYIINMFHRIAFFLVTSQLGVVKQQFAEPNELQILCVV